MEELATAIAIEDEGKKYDSGKVPWSLMPVGPMEIVVRAAEHGAKKYGKDNWQRLDDPRERYVDAAYRHIAAWREGEKCDPESKVHHLGHAICSLIFVLWFDLKLGKSMDFWETRCHEMETIVRRLELRIVKMKQGRVEPPTPPPAPSPEDNGAAVTR